MSDTRRLHPVRRRTAIALATALLAGSALTGSVVDAARSNGANDSSTSLSNAAHPILYRIPLIWNVTPPDRDLPYVLQLFDGREALTSGADMHLTTIGEGIIPAGADALEVRLDPSALSKHRSRHLRSGHFRFNVMIVDTEFRGVQSFERWHPAADSAVAAGRSATDVALQRRKMRWAAGPVDGQVIANQRSAGATTEEAVETAIDSVIDELSVEERAYNEDGVPQGLVVNAITAETVGVSGFAAPRSTPAACGSQPYMFAMFRYKNDFTTRNLKVADAGTKNNTTVKVTLTNAAKTSTQGVLNMGSSSLTGYKTFSTQSSGSFNTQSNNQKIEFLMNVRYNYYRMQCPDLNNSNVWYDLPEYEYVPKQWTGGATNRSVTSLGWSCGTNYRVSIGANLLVSKGVTRGWSSGLTVTLGGINAGVKQSYSTTTSYSIDYREDAGASAQVCGYLNDPSVALKAQEV